MSFPKRKNLFLSQHLEALNLIIIWKKKLTSNVKCKQHIVYSCFFTYPQDFAYKYFIKQGNFKMAIQLAVVVRLVKEGSVGNGQEFVMVVLGKTRKNPQENYHIVPQTCRFKKNDF